MENCFLSSYKNSIVIFLLCNFFASSFQLTSDFEKNADKIAEILQRMAQEDLIYEHRRSTMTSPSRRRTIQELTENLQGPSRMMGNFERLFRRKLHNPNASGIVSSKTLISLNLNF